MSKDNYFYFGVTMDTPVMHRLKSGMVALFVRPAPYKQESNTGCNQDAAAVITADDDSIVLAIADGMGGAPAGDVAARLAIESLASSLREAKAFDLRDAILNGIEKANKAILNLENGAATTLAVVEIHADRLRSYHVGDSGIIVTGQRGRLKQQTTAHSPTGYAVEAGFIDENEALEHKERNIVSNVVGSHELRIEIGPPVRLAPRDTVVLASDGLFDNMLTEEIIEQVRFGDLQHSAASLVQQCEQRMQGQLKDGVSGHPDDLGFILYRPQSHRSW